MTHHCLMNFRYETWHPTSRCTVWPSIYPLTSCMANAGALQDGQARSLHLTEVHPGVFQEHLPCPLLLVSQKFISKGTGSGSTLAQRVRCLTLAVLLRVHVEPKSRYKDSCSKSHWLVPAALSVAQLQRRMLGLPWHSPNSTCDLSSEQGKRPSVQKTQRAFGDIIW